MRIAVIPARKGSKRLPGKNTRMFRGKPMLLWSIEAAKDSGLFDATIVTSDDDRALEIAAAAGVVPIRRPEALAGDDVPLTQVTAGLLRQFDDKPEQICLLMANCPLRVAADIVDCHRTFEESGAQGAMTVVRYGWLRPEWAMRLDGNRLDRIDTQTLAPSAADGAALVCPTGAVRWVDAQSFLAQGVFYTKKLAGHLLPWHRAVDIDTFADLQVAECIGHALDTGFAFEDAPQ
jgi:pseudaminic acid cytidylyltransferase